MEKGLNEPHIVLASSAVKLQPYDEYQNALTFFRHFQKDDIHSPLFRRSFKERQVTSVRRGILM
jgi:hypothetical protein